ncbi:hypothetical protein DNTS_006241 [Danionella cerebrum]|uniref:catechol O-methyltransferase n=1 Tax=Danionella cerebrum TaxID=2873325 RepID=A0A553R7Q8_9TELE|nr:hypothetical protein DNTS_006241 [Danionella translucida]
MFFKYLRSCHNLISVMLLSLVFMPLLPVVVGIMTTMAAVYHLPLLALFSQVFSGFLKLSQRKVCVRSIHSYVFNNCTHGQAESVLMTFDLYSNMHATLNIGPVKGEFLDMVVKSKCPQRALEFGTHCGYASVRILRMLPPTGKLLTVEVDPLTADYAEEIILIAGFKHHQGSDIWSSKSSGIYDRQATELQLG